MMAPVLVPAIRSKWSASGTPNRFSISAAKAAVNAPRMPPPSRLRMRNCRLLPDSTFSVIGLLLFLGPDRLSRPGIDATAQPDPQDAPGFVVEQPLRNPWHDRVRQRHLRRPLAGPGQVQAEPVAWV